ncbi:MAG TPA: ABC transporter substrate-binding protein [Candidatus Paceibacterota bacterium]|nr:ABC transporter substrate-binding protein [Candidatus Paceibacterota bacterium]HSA03151.1 ABC transporter substrate-binding protein [Candidatus Paceibacterota bacterium]
MVGIKGAKAFIAARLREQASRRGHDSQNGPDSERWIAPLHVSGLRAINDDTLIIELDQPDPVFPFMWPCIAQPREEVERSDVPFGLRGVGDGPYRVGEWIRGKRLVLEPNPHYSGQEPRHFDRIDIMIGGDASTHLMMFERGELDVAEIENFTLPIADHARIASNPKWRSCLEESLAGASVYVVLNTEVIPFNHLKVRQALNYAVNKPRCLHVSGGRWMVGAGILPPLIPGYNPKLQGYPYDPDKARALLAASDVPRPIRLSLWYPHEFECVMIAQRIQADLRGAGVEVELKEVTPAEMGMALSVRGKVPMALFGFITSVPDPKDLLVSLFDGRSLSNSYSYNFAFYANPKVDRLLDEAAAELRMPTRYALFQQAEEIIVRDAPFIFLGYPKFFALKQPWIKGRLIEPLWPFRLDRIWKE